MAKGLTVVVFALLVLSGVLGLGNIAAANAATFSAPVALQGGAPFPPPPPPPGGGGQ